MVILEEETFKKYGYYPCDLKPLSGKTIIVACDKCGKIREIRKSSYRALCMSCACKEKPHSVKSNKIRRVCLVCGKTIMVAPSRMKIGRGKFCSRKCAGIYQSKNRIGETSAAWKGGKIRQTCLICGKTYMVIPARIKKGIGKYCSQKCADIARRGSFTGDKNPKWKGGKIKRICGTCGKEFMVSLSRIEEGKGKFCCYKCAGAAQSKNRTGENHPNWQGGISFEPYCEKFNDEFKEYIRIKFDRKCYLCGKTEEENGKKLSVHHCNYQKLCGCAQNEEDQKEDDKTCQFIPLCVSCHAKVHGDREKWERYFRNTMRNCLTGWYI